MHSGKKVWTFILQPFTASWGMGSDNDRIQAMFQKDHPGRERWDGIAAMDETAAEDLQCGAVL